MMLGFKYICLLMGTSGLQAGPEVRVVRSAPVVWLTRVTVDLTWCATAITTMTSYARITACWSTEHTSPCTGFATDIPVPELIRIESRSIDIQVGPVILRTLTNLVSTVDVWDTCLCVSVCEWDTIVLAFAGLNPSITLQI